MCWSECLWDDEEYDTVEHDIIDRVAWAAELASFGYSEDEIIEIMGLSQENDKNEQ